MNPLRLTSFALLAAGLLMLILDVIERLVARNWNGMALGYIWGIMLPGSLRATGAFIEQKVSVLLWQQILLPMLSLPAWVFIFVLGGLCYVIGKKFED